MLLNLEKFNKKDTKINLVSLTFSIKSYKKNKGEIPRELDKCCKSFFSSLI